MTDPVFVLIILTMICLVASPVLGAAGWYLVHKTLPAIKARREARP